MYVIPLALLIGAAAGLFVRGSTDYFLATRVVFTAHPRGWRLYSAPSGVGIGVHFRP